MGRELETIDLTVTQRKEISSLLKRYLPGVEVWAYGSRVKWTSRPESDLDLVVFSAPEQNSQVFALKEAFEESSLPFRVDLFVWDEVPEQFHKNIQSEQVVLQKSDEKRGSGSEWTEYTLGDIAVFAYGKMPKSNTLTEGRYPTFSGYKYQYKYPEYNCDKGDVIVVARGVGGTGDVKIVKERCYLTNLSIKITLDNEIMDNRYFYYNYLNLNLRHLDSGSAQSQITINDLTRESIFTPPLPDQRAIAHILGTLDDKIELNRRMNETLEAMAQAVFKSWFVDFDPVRAKAEGRDTGLPKEIADLFPDRFQDSKLGRIPLGWVVKPINDSVKVFGGGTPSTKIPEYWDAGTNPFVTPKDMSSLTSPVILDTSRHITEAGVKKISSGRLPAGTVILSSRAPIGYLAISEIQVSVNQGVIAMVCDKELPNYYVLYWTKTNMDSIKSRASGTTFAEISKRNFKPILTIIPNEHVLENYVNQVEPLFQQLTINLLESEKLASLRDALLPKLISGELRVPDAERFLEDAGV